MSIAGKRSSQGDDYQLLIALHWLIRMLKDDSISYVQVEAIHLPGETKLVSVDDVVVIYKDGKKTFIQAKKNQPMHGEWKLADGVFKEELIKAYQQHKNNPNDKIMFYSRSPFGVLKKTAEDCRILFPEYSAFTENAPKTLLSPLLKMSKILNEENTENIYQFVKKISFGSTLEYEDWEYKNIEDLSQLVTNAELSIALLEKIAKGHQSGVGQTPSQVLTAEGIKEVFSKEGLVLSPKYDEKQLLEEFKLLSSIGRNINCSIKGEKIQRSELDRLKELVEKKQSVLVTEGPGSGKSCLLIALADHIEGNASKGLLFLKGEEFTQNCDNLGQVNKGLDGIVGKVARLAEQRPVVVIIDSLDVIALNREHHHLHYFLSLIDQFESINNVVVIAACRSFDLKYDQNLRNRKWQNKVDIQVLDFDTTILPLLKKWHINHAILSNELKILLGVPQNLKLFAEIASFVNLSTLHSSYQLQEAFIEEIIVKDDKLGVKALTLLEQVADNLITYRTQSTEKSLFSCDERILRRLLSQDVLHSLSKTEIRFSHQTLLDAFVIRHALTKKQTLSQFIHSHPPLPFIRPLVRAFFFHLRAHDQKLFRKQVWETVTDESIAYHLRRLIIESISEIIPENSDWSLIRRIFNNHPELFKRLFWRLNSKEWFQFITKHWLPITKDQEEWHFQFISRTEIWMNESPEECVQYWLEALNREWNSPNNLTWQLKTCLNRFDYLHLKGVREVLDALIARSGKDRDFIETTIKRYVVKTNTGMDLVWSRIENALSIEDNRHSHDLNAFFKDDFLLEQLKQSPTFLTKILESLVVWAKDNNYENKSDHPFRSSFLNNSSWERTHNDYDTYSGSDISVFINTVEQAIYYHANKNTEWWCGIEPTLRGSNLQLIQYFLIKAYLQNPEENIDSIEAKLTSSVLLRYGSVSYELGELIQSSYHLLSSQSQELNQQEILALYQDDDDDRDINRQWVINKKWKLLTRIPCIFRIPQSQQFIDQWRGSFSSLEPEPQIYGWGGSVTYPIDNNHFNRFLDVSIVKLLDHYSDYDERSEKVGDIRAGGRGQIERLLQSATEKDPLRFILLLPEIKQKQLHPVYIKSILRGASYHLDYRFGRLRTPDGFVFVEPLPKGEYLAEQLLTLLEHDEDIWLDPHLPASILEACSYAILGADLVETMVSLLFKLQCADDPSLMDRVEVNDRSNIRLIAQDTAHGVSATATIILYKRLVENRRKIPNLLVLLLHHCARHPILGIRSSILDYIPYLTSIDHTMGWKLFDDIFEKPNSMLWEDAEQCLYYQYHQHYEKVEPYLLHIYKNDLEQAGGVWGRIATLSCLSNHIPKENLWADLEAADEASCWLGATTVFVSNIDSAKHKELCNEMLIRILKRNSDSIEIISEIENYFDSEKRRNGFTIELVEVFIQSIHVDGQKCDLYHFFIWLDYISEKNPITALELAEKLENRLSSLEFPCQIWSTKSLVSMLVNILKEADELDDPDLIHRAISLQDNFLALNLEGIEDIFKLVIE